jgi:hypothetical protein
MQFAQNNSSETLTEHGEHQHTETSVILLQVFENRVLRRIFGLKRDFVVGGWGKLHSEELRNL